MIINGHIFAIQEVPWSYTSSKGPKNIRTYGKVQKQLNPAPIFAQECDETVNSTIALEV